MTSVSKENSMSFETEINNVADEIVSLLIEKNKAYGNSALEPVRIFSKSDTLEQLNVRIDDKSNTGYAFFFNRCYSCY
jgi:hypothetical protein